MSDKEYRIHVLKGLAVTIAAIVASLLIIVPLTSFIIQQIEVHAANTADQSTQITIQDTKEPRASKESRVDDNVQYYGPFVIIESHAAGDYLVYHPDTNVMYYINGKGYMIALLNADGTPMLYNEADN